MENTFVVKQQVVYRVTKKYDKNKVATLYLVTDFDKDRNQVEKLSMKLCEEHENSETFLFDFVRVEYGGKEFKDAIFQSIGEIGERISKQIYIQDELSKQLEKLI